ncbi:SpoIID/LytB domain-containing protein [Virgibacillus soli]|uniref:SpoIID/LytB domain-containing protein n=1 Tax=Paracerasibacillus soli TaxID=480284 RepID=A0ABU5CUZ5_9BACI|nr:SpoIID/LytB domain-containing protein [Virgibacillus soli]MDY0410197.1 SpoIID/LytB domain-containing protein [Virgibacillus soli]
MLTACKSKRTINLIAVFTLILSTVVQFMLPGQTVLGAAESENIYSEKIMAKSSSSLELEIQGALPLATSYEVYRLVDGELEAVSYREVRVGAENVTVEVNQDNEITKMILNGYTPIENMRVGIMTTDFVTLEHDEIEVQSATGLEIVDKVADEILLINPNELITIQAQQHEVTIMTEDGTTLYTTTNRIYVSTEENGKIIVDNIRRGSEWTPVEASYRGFFEITATHSGDKLHLINEVNLEDYLYQVVPSEMPASFGLEALKAQSVAARTYALGDYFSERFTEDGFFVLDSVMSQVYNNAPENALTTQAVQETAGIVMRDETGGLVDARYYSTSAGYGASKHEVWSEADGTFPSSVVPYLLAQSHTFDPDNPDQMLELDTSDEEEMLHFFKTLSYTGYDDASDFFRWKTTLSKEELGNTINKNLTLRQQADPKFVLTQNDAGQFVSLPIPEAGIGEFQDMYVTKRGEGGNIMDLVIEGTTGTYKVIKEYNIRFVIRPWSPDTGGDPVTLYMARAGSDGYDAPSREDFNILPSAFFSVEIDEESEDITFFGGGYGHGVGMSQYGAYHLGESKGWAFDEILTAYYPNMVLDDIYEENDTDPGDGDDNDTGDGSEVPTIEDMLALIVKFEEEGEFANDSVARALTIHLTSVNQFVKKEENEKVLKHMDGFKLLLDHHREQESVSESAYDTLLNQANQFVSSYETTLEIK